MSAKDDINRVIANLSKMSAAMLQEITWGCEAVQAKCVNDARGYCPNFTGTLAQSIQPGAVVLGDGVVEAYVEANIDYASFVEFGTKPHFPPIEALEDWCAKVLGDAKLAFVVARAISRRGTYAHPFMGPALIENMPVFRTAVEAGVKRGLAVGY
jgi:hypothetical protein